MNESDIAPHSGAFASFPSRTIHKPLSAFTDAAISSVEEFSLSPNSLYILSSIFSANSASCLLLEIACVSGIAYSHFTFLIRSRQLSISLATPRIYLRSPIRLFRQSAFPETSSRIFLVGIFPQKPSSSRRYSTFSSAQVSNRLFLSRKMTNFLSASLTLPCLVILLSSSAGDSGSS